MKFLWLTVADPEPPTNGQYIYTGGLIGALADAGIELDVLALARPSTKVAAGTQDGQIRWWLAEHRPRSKWASLISPLPHQANRTRTDGKRRLLGQLFADRRHDAIIFDGLTPGWALTPVREYRRRGPNDLKVVYVAHNHEASLAKKVARVQPHAPKRLINWVDALKVGWLERELVGYADLVTSNSPVDCTLFRADAPDRRVDFLPPGYGGHRVVQRRITADVPRRAIILGSFDWLAKRRNMVEFLDAAQTTLAPAGIELHVVGNAEETFLDRLRGKYKFATFTGRVQNVSSHLANARIALVPERTGAGFKLKVLDYIFHRVPIVAYDGSVAGTPLKDGQSVVFCPSHAAVARKVVELIDDFDALNRMHDLAYTACSNTFDWSSRASQLVTAIEGVRLAPRTATATRPPVLDRQPV